MEQSLRAAVLATLLTSFPALLASQSNPITGAAAIDVARSTLTVHVYRSGIFSFAADNHEIRAPVASGSIDEGRRSVEFMVDPRQMTVLDPGLDAKKRAQVQETMLGPEVLDGTALELCVRDEPSWTRWTPGF